ncbi:hypothetical protein D3C87_593450 [compost metagenome]|uniref:hypothetical protein n=1 Tax=Pedobacter ghigonis TaxID=2730403 RepID=UPI000FA033C0|nr:hypothetical protein [Pedobacter ghigonis]
MATTTFNIFIVPGEVKDGKFQLSLCFELNTEHDVLTGKQTDEKEITRWKETVLQFPELARFMHKNGQLILRQAKGKDIPLIARKQLDVNAAKDAAKLWAEFLGYHEVAKESFVPRKKEVDPLRVGTASTDTLRVLPSQPLPLVISAYPTIAPITEAMKKNFLASKAIFPESVDRVMIGIESHPLLASSKILPKSVMEGIGAAYQADIDANKLRFIEMGKAADLYKHNQITKFAPEALAKLSPENQKAMRLMIGFQRIAASVINEPIYIKEAVHKLGGNLGIRRFLGTLVDFEIPISEFNSSELSVELSLANNTNPLHKLINDNVDFQYRTKVVKEPGLNAILPAPIDVEYQKFYAGALARLADKTRIITHESESLVRNYAQAKDSIRQNPTLANLKLDSAMFLKSKAAIDPNLKSTEKVAIQSSQIILNTLNKAAAKLNNRVVNIQTKGHQLVVTDEEWLKYDPNQTTRPATDIYEHDILNGFVIYQRIKEDGKVVSNWHSLSRVKEYFGEALKLNKVFEKTDIAINTDSFINSLVVDPATNDPQLQGVNTGFLFHFDGTTVSSRNPLKHYEKEYEDEQTQKDEEVLDFAEKVNASPPERTAVVLANKKLIAEDYFPFKRKVNAKYVLARDFVFKSQGDEKTVPNLKFSETRTYEYVMAMQYINGYSPVDENWLIQHTASLNGYISEPAKFLRHEHIKDIIVSMNEDIFHPGTKKTKPQYTGETVNDLVIRKGTLLNNDECIRLLSPPPVPTFQTYLWYDFENNDSFAKSRNLSSLALYPFYNKYQCELKPGDELKGKTCKQNCGAYCGGTAQPPVYSGKLNYLPDPIVNGFNFKFFYDKDCIQCADRTIYPDTFCELKKGFYPQLQPWTIKLVRSKPKTAYVAKDLKTQVLTIYVPEGKQIFAECRPTYHKDFACFEQAPVLLKTLQEEMESDMTVNPLHCGVIVLSFTSALQKPLFEPEILDILFTKYKKGTPNRVVNSVTAKVELNFEHLNHWGELQVQGTQPTGELELYGLWEDYSLNKRKAQRSIAEKKNDAATGGFVFLGKYEFKNPEDSSSPHPSKIGADEIASSNLKNTIVFEFEPSFPIHYFTPSVFKVRNTSKYVSYFEDINANEKNQINKEYFGRWSKETTKPATVFNPISYSKPGLENTASAGYLFNNLKPEIPVVEKIIPLIVRDDQKLAVSYYERYRIYYHNSLMGKDGRLGILINDGKSIYRNQLKGCVSHAGIDSVMDNFGDRLALSNNQLGRANFNVDANILEERYIEKFDPKFDDFYTSNAEVIGMISYTPDYDASQGLWYIDIELKIKNKAKLDLHSPFIQLGLVNYQPRSANYAMQSGSVADTASAYAEDLRVSDPVKADFFAIRPRRSFKNPFVLFKHKSIDRFSLSGAISSLYFKDNVAKKELKSEFVLCVQEEGNSDFWEVIPSKLFKKQYKLDGTDVGREAQGVELRYHPLLTGLDKFPLSHADQSFEVQFGIWFEKVLFGKHRIVIYEIECHNSLKLADLPPLLVNGEIQHVYGVNVINNFIFWREASV